MQTAHLLRQYQAPKWQAKIVDSAKQFHFNDQYHVTNLWELKRALREVDDEVLAPMIKDQNHIANWVESVINDQQLAELLRQNNTRWGMIVNLERHMMRSLYLPHYVAQRWLGPAVSSFDLADGTHINSIYELKQAFESHSDDDLKPYFQKIPSDFVLWAEGSLGDYILADLLSTAHNREQAITIIGDHLSMLEEARQLAH